MKKIHKNNNNKEWNKIQLGKHWTNNWIWQAKDWVEEGKKYYEQFKMQLGT
jgi:hypothetical protein